ncbi:esterase-like activity of phytase family protein [Flavobacterium sp. CS20]|uniref:esterase-like activity of phytase family protein n=1 Tax=Flavobacterium sp. CS20 TaxID=2775246 RepID=UPI001B3A5747|nr:esterase-like activity of phytase family protein [Flavobacterium sp. CS20]QTY26870.1 esterase-like activity of phytase family protein [Flavobacterium sp. CS20]
MRLKPFTISYNVHLLNVVAFFMIFNLIGCKTAKLNLSATYQVKFLDEFILEKKSFENTEIGGLSGIDYNGDYFVLISDKSTNPDIFKADIQIENDKIKAVNFNNHQIIKCNTIKRFDTESIRFLPDATGYLVSTEGAINSNENAQIIEVDEQGQCQKKYDLPKHFDVNHFNQPRHNGVFEGLSIDYSKRGFWVVNELPLIEDGHKPKLYNSFSPVRITHYNFDNSQPDVQYSYDLERLVKIPFLPFGLNGATEILQIDKRHIVLIERSFSAGHSSKGNRVKLFLIDISKGKNTLDIRSLKKNKAKSMPKTLIFDSKNIRKQLQKNFIDNIEGISFGPDLPNGNKSLILISDNNFNALGKQLNQFVLLELIKPNQ